MIFEVVTLFPELFESFLRASLLGKAIERGLLTVRFTNPRDFTTDKHKSVDDAPYGGGAGMVMRVEPLCAAIESIVAERGPAHRILLAPAAPRLDHVRVRALAALPRVVLVCGRYEGIDERVRDLVVDEALSIGDYVLSGGETAAMVLIDAVARFVPGVLGDAASTEEESFAEGTLEFPHYTRPAEFRGLAVPEVLTSGNHERVRKWRHEQSLDRTARWRPDLLPRLGPASSPLPKGDPAALARRTWVALVHHPVTEKSGKIVTTAVTNLDIHDIARATRTFDLAGYFVVTPIAAQRELVGRIIGHWTEGSGREHNDKRSEALERVHIVDSIDAAVAHVTQAAGHAPLVVATGAKPRGNTLSFDALAEKMNDVADIGGDPGIDKPMLVLFGTGWGLAESVFGRVDAVLPPIRAEARGVRAVRAAPSNPEYNHLSVRSAVAIVLDRLFGAHD